MSTVQILPILLCLYIPNTDYKNHISHFIIIAKYTLIQAKLTKASLLLKECGNSFSQFGNGTLKEGFSEGSLAVDCMVGRHSFAGTFCLSNHIFPFL